MLDRLQRALEDAALDRPTRDDSGRRLDLECLRAGTCGLVVEDPVPDAVTAREQRPIRAEARVDRLRRLVPGHTKLGMRGDVPHPFVHHLERERRLVEHPGRPRVGEPDHLVRRIAVVVEHPLTRGERLVRVVHVELVLEVVAPVDDRDVDLPAEDHPAPVRRVHRLAVALAPRRRRHAAVGREVHVARAPDVDVPRRARPDEGTALLHHLGRRLPGADVRVQVEELRGRDLAFAQRLQPVLDADVVPRHSRVPGRVGAVDVHQVVPVRPLRGELLLRRDARRRPVPRVERERREATPAVDALRRARRRHVRHQRGIRIPEGCARVQALDQRPVDPRSPHRERIRDDLRIGPPLEQLAVADVDRLRDHVGIGVLRDRRVEQSGMVLAVHVLLDRPARAADGDRVARLAVRRDEPVLDHDRRLASELEVVVRRRDVAGRVRDCVSEGEAGHVEHRVALRVPLVVADRHTALELVEQHAVPRREVRRRGLACGRERRDRVDEAVDDAALPADDEVDRVAVHRRGRRHVRRARCAGRVRAPCVGRSCGTAT